MVGINQKCIRFNKGLTFLLIISIFFSINFVLFAVINIQNVTKASSGNGAIVFEQSSKRVLYGENIDAKLPMASTTKILTALVVLNNVDDLDRKFKIPAKAVGIEGSSIYLQKGEELTIKELLYGLMLRSGNDSAVALAIATAGSVEEFVILMNETARDVGAKNSNFVNPHGLHDDNHYTTAYDLGLITCVAMENPIFCQIIATKLIKINGKEPRYLANKNKMLSKYEGANGVKTGYTKKSGRCLVSAAKRDGMQLVCVVINHGGMWADSICMMNNAFNQYKMREVYKIEDYQTMINVKNGQYPKVIVTPENPLNYPLTDKEFNNLKINVNLDENVNAPVKNGNNVGKLEVYNGNCLLFSSDFITMHNVDKKRIFKKIA